MNRKPSLILPTEAWERFLADGDDAALLKQLRTLTPRAPPRDAPHPEYHRICDVELCGQAYRVSRLVDLANGAEQLFIQATDTPGFDQPGVPYWLRGAALARWIREETECPTDDEIGWDAYR